MSQVEEWTPEIFSMGSGFKARVLYAQRKALAPVHLCLLCCPLTQSRLKLHSLLTVLWTQLPSPVIFLLVFSLPTISPCCPCVENLISPWKEPTQTPFLYEVFSDFTNQSSPLCQPQMIILHSEFPRHFIFILFLTKLSTLCYSYA